jgi:hypothetical protein
MTVTVPPRAKSLSAGHGLVVAVTLNDMLDAPFARKRFDIDF